MSRPRRAESGAKYLSEDDAAGSSNSPYVPEDFPNRLQGQPVFAKTPSVSSIEETDKDEAINTSTREIGGRRCAPESEPPPQISKAKHAVIWIKKASNGSSKWVRHCSQEQFRWWYLSKQLKPLWLLAKYGFLLLSVFEEPAPCRGTKEQCLNMNHYWYSMPFTILPLNISAILSLAFCMILLFRMRLRKWALGSAYSCPLTPGTAYADSWVVFNSIVLAVALICSMAGFVSPGIYEISFICRPLIFVGATKKLRQEVAAVLRAAPSYLDVIFSLYMAVFVFACAGMILFVKTPEGNADFRNWGDAFAQMMVLFFTSNDPNAWVPAFNSNKFNFVFFFFYLSITLYLLLSLLLARVYNGYKEVGTADVEVFHRSEQVSVEFAFGLLSDSGDIDGQITAESWREFFIEYCNPSFGGIQVEDLEDTQYNTWRGDLIVSVFHGIDLERGASISLENFRTIMKVFIDRETYIPAKRPPVARPHGQFWTFLHDSYMNGFEIGGVTFDWDSTMDVVISIVFLFTCWEGFAFANGKPLLKIAIFWVLLPITFMYGMEVTAKISILGFDRFWNKNSLQNRFDFLNMYSLIIIEIIYLAGAQTMAMQRAIILLSGVRVFRLCRYVQPLKHVFLMLTRLIPSYWKVGMMFLIVYFIFAAVGRWMFGGLIYSTNPDLWQKCGSHAIGANSCGPGYVPANSYGPGASPFGSRQYAQDQFFSLNFNDTISGFLTLFALMIVNNWYITTSGFMLACGSVWVAWYFILFFIVCNLVVLNILMALIIDVTAAFSEEEAQDFSHTSQQAVKVKRLNEIERVATGIGAQKPEYMLRRVLDKEDELYTKDWQDHGAKPRRIRSAERLARQYS